MTVTMKSKGFASCPQNLCESVISVRVESGVSSPAVATRHFVSSGLFNGAFGHHTQSVAATMWRFSIQQPSIIAQS